MHATTYVLISIAPVIEYFPKDLKVMEGDDIILKVVVIGDPEPIYTWHYEGSELLSNMSREILSNGSLIISSTSVRHSGTYKLTANNSYGSTKKELKLFVLPCSVTRIDVRGSTEVPPIDLESFGEYVCSHHTKENRGFKKQFAVY